MKNLFGNLVKIGTTVAAGYAAYKIIDGMAEKTAKETIEIENEYNSACAFMEEVVNIETEEELKDIKTKRVISYIKAYAEYYGKLILLGGVYGIATAAIWANPKKTIPQRINTINYQIEII